MWCGKPINGDIFFSERSQPESFKLLLALPWRQPPTRQLPIEFFLNLLCARRSSH
jgi:hypothetical protein